jgi:two-component system phosphate regulon response regulator PhoB
MYSVELSETPGRPTVGQYMGQIGRIFLLETEELLREMLALALEEQGYEVVVALDGRNVLPMLQGSAFNPNELSFNLLIMDSINGLDLCRMLRHQGNSVPILIIGARGSANNCAFYLEAGADDYLTKPFGMREFIARCRALMRRQRLGQLPQPVMLQYKAITLYPEECRVMIRGEEVKLSPKQFRLLELFMSYPRRVWSRDQLLDQVWGPDFMGDSKTVDVHIRWLREKLELDPSQPEYIITVRGFGYRFG